jgi:hypothetical protein
MLARGCYTRKHKENSKYMLLFRKHNAGEKNNMVRINNFKMWQNSDICVNRIKSEFIREENKNTLKSSNACNHPDHNLLHVRLLPEYVRIRTLSLVLYEWETCLCH